ncbi:MAG: 2-oxoacid:ferredoxin oxidoreductase subunit beta [Candidatus Thermoplasmatota archaeon]|jgi:2-oxoglutarate ferredoxin oxidoreductase subunit beta|nr:2-oxoacid:ferredoxin oxidoreductase subunit beta [Candidatus Thermoplasmatota archaeon]MCL5791220.1 2-oxoacid:ferredoxin oxidoreductase subunit beta [Candidatus Thermoplasmatota archaeon]
MAHNFKTDLTVDWCPGCGDFGIVTSITSAMTELNLDPLGVVMVSGIGCSGKTPHYINVAGMHTLHGRAIPYATGVKLANPKLKVLVTGGDGDLMGIGAGHLVAEGRRNTGITVMIYDNEVYGLTKGQAAPTMPLGEQTKSLTKPNIFTRLNPIALALSSGYSFVARGFSFDMKQLKDIIKKAINHPGSAVIDILQPCPTYNNINTMEWYKERVYKLEDDKEWDPVVSTENISHADEKFSRAMLKAQEWGEKIPTGIFYQNTAIEPFTKRINRNVPNYLDITPSEQVISTDAGFTIVDPEKTFADKIIG